MTNVRRENKLYSYEEQMAEIELRKEIEKKKKAKGIQVEPKLTKQQLEAKHSQLEKESEIRMRVKEVCLPAKLHQLFVSSSKPHAEAYLCIDQCRWTIK